LSWPPLTSIRANAPVIARRVSAVAIQLNLFSAHEIFSLDCFASLAMTEYVSAYGLPRPSRSTDAALDGRVKPGYDGLHGCAPW